MGKLAQLADGNWIDLTTVTGLVVYPGPDDEGRTRPPSVTVFIGSGRTWTRFSSWEAAIAERDRLATLVNQATDRTDARLSDAAPNLLVALTELVGVCRELEAFDGRVTSRVRYLTRAEAAIAKATKP